MKEAIGDAVLICGDSFGYEPAPVHALVTDSPYGLNKKVLGGGCLGKLKDYGDITWDNATIPWPVMQAFIDEAAEAVIFGGNYYPVPPSARWFIWDKVNGQTNFADCEMAWSNLKGATRLKRYMWNGMLRQQPLTILTRRKRLDEAQRQQDLFAFA